VAGFLHTIRQDSRNILTLSTDPGYLQLSAVSYSLPDREVTYKCYGSAAFDDRVLLSATASVPVRDEVVGDGAYSALWQILDWRDRYLLDADRDGR
jgi:hypothetical protein